MTREEFKKLYKVLEDANPGEYEYDGEDIISTHIFKGIWVSIINVVDIEGKDSWSDCYDLRNANGKLWHVEDLRRKRQEIIEEVQNAAENVFTRPI